ncbi:DUF4268 domain-containing protein [Butyrivibrio sp. CB08]|uniref:DUF4268 domain-containing protein n=1 Tax=Butyrivibrio sp. CB08 TaxID=2364879 RepID=UPI000EA8D656|nr:DUF4268 domain-containing protein [Butyrivibrio sp. CB08]RKM55395.1 DUF4268 domain-containing protein [Butyrivibrio sp. CB08]
MISSIGKLEEVDIRDLWSHEQYDFSEWLSNPENLELLNEEIGTSLTEVEKEVFVGAYRCDLVGVDETTGDKIIIENQLEASNHEHLGKLITYASGLDAKIIVWVVREAREEHKSAIEWLNNNTSEEIGFFLIEIHAYKIGDSLPAAKFAVVESPNGFIKSSKANTNNGDTELRRSQSERMIFWTRFQERLRETKAFNPKKVSTHHFCNLPIGNSQSYISVTLIDKEGYIGVSIYIPDNKDFYDKLAQYKDEINQKAGNVELKWMRLDNKKASRILTMIPDLDFDNHDNYDELIQTTIDRAVFLRDLFKPYISKIL